MVGLEIHQQLNTGKLFCGCPSEISEGEPDYIIKRRLRISQGESGKTDLAAIHEVAKHKEFHYYCYNDTTCLVELDEEPPHRINPKALNIALNVAQILNCRILDRIAVMRKIVLDGSNTSGFQRTALVGINGYIMFGGKRISIPTVCIEEDAAKVVKRTKSYDIYNLSRLGIPLVEIATGPDITSGEMCQGIAGHIGMLLRSLPGIKRGLGSIRQDVNVSIPGGARVEIKGAQELRMLAKVVKLEGMRQKSLLELNLTAQKPTFVDVSKVFNKCRSQVIKKSLRVNGIVLGAKLSGMKGLLGRELQPGKRIGTELSDFAKVKAGIGGLFHSDELPGYGISEEETAEIHKILKCKKPDGFVIIAERKSKAERAMKAVIERLNMLSKGVPEEVRKVNPNGTSTYLRPLPGHARMYPETDLPLITPKISSIKPVMVLTEVAKELEVKHKLSKDLARLTVRSPKIEFITTMIERFNRLKPSFIAETVLSAKKVIKKEFNKGFTPSDSAFERVFSLLNEGRISKDVVFEVLSKTDKKAVEELARDYAGLDPALVEEEVKNIVTNNPGAPFNALMGIIMRRFKGRVPGNRVAELLKKHIK